MDFTHVYQAQQEIKLHQALQENDFDAAVEHLLMLHTQGWAKVFAHGDFQRWRLGFENLPDVQTHEVKLSDCVQVGSSLQTNVSHELILEGLQALHPWRKGPFDVFGVHIDTEWRSDWKWQRVLPHLSPLKQRTVLDIGCGSGYHMWRMIEAGAKLVLGIDPSPLFSFHFATIKRYQPDKNCFLIPTGIDEMPNDILNFDTVFSMGILYHRKQPLEHLYKIKSLLKKGGELVLETLVVDGDETTCLVPHGRYAQMRNVWFIPSVAMLTIWLERVGFKDVRCVDLNTTSTDEQRTTAWMRFESLADFLDAKDNSKTIEGYQAPMRAVMVATV